MMKYTKRVKMFMNKWKGNMIYKYPIWIMQLSWLKNSPHTQDQISCQYSLLTTHHFQISLTNILHKLQENEFPLKNTKITFQKAKFIKHASCYLNSSDTTCTKNKQYPTLSELWNNFPHTTAYTKHLEETFKQTIGPQTKHTYIMENQQPTHLTFLHIIQNTREDHNSIHHEQYSTHHYTGRL